MFRAGSRIRQTPEEGGRIYQLKRYEYNNNDKDNNPKTLKDKNHQVLSQKFRQVIYISTAPAGFCYVILKKENFT